MDDTFTYCMDGARYAAAREFFPVASAAGLAPAIISRTEDVFVVERGIPLPDWLGSAGSESVSAMREHVLAMIARIHALGMCHRDLHWANVVIVDGEPRAIDFEHAIRTDPASRCYDLFGPSGSVPLLPDHAALGGVVATHGIWWGAERDERWGAAYTPLGYVFGPLR